MKDFKSQSIDYEVALRRDGVLIGYKKGFYSVQEAEEWAQDNMQFESGCRYDIIAVTRQIIKSRRS